MWILPSYKRPEQCKAVLEACVAKGMTTPGILIVNGPAEGYDFGLPAGWTRHHEPANIGFAAALNRGVELAPGAAWYGVLSDDCYPETDGWDRALVEAAGDRNIAHCNDQWHADLGRAAGIVVLGGGLVRALGFLTVPGTWHSYCDDLWEAIWADFNNRAYLRDVICRNPHPMKGDAVADETFKTAYGINEQGKLAQMEKDGEVYRTWMNSKAKRKAWNRIRALFPKEVANKRPVMVFDADPKRPVPVVNIKPRPFNPREHGVLIATPCADETTKLSYTQSLYREVVHMMNLGLSFKVQFVTKCSMVDHARNKHVYEFLNNEENKDCTHLVFIDDDMGWGPGAVARLIAHDKPVIAAVGCTRSFSDRRYAVRLDAETSGYDQKRGLVRVTSVGTGFMCIQRHVIEQMAKIELDAGRGYRTVEGGKNMYAPLFEFVTNRGVKFGEDYTFCNKWRAMGGEIWVDPGIPLAHQGSHVFMGYFQRWLEENEAFVPVPAEEPKAKARRQKKNAA